MDLMPIKWETFYDNTRYIYDVTCIYNMKVHVVHLSLLIGLSGAEDYHWDLGGEQGSHLHVLAQVPLWTESDWAVLVHCKKHQGILQWVNCSFVKDCPWISWQYFPWCSSTLFCKIKWLWICIQGRAHRKYSRHSSKKIQVTQKSVKYS